MNSVFVPSKKTFPNVVKNKNRNKNKLDNFENTLKKGKHKKINKLIIKPESVHNKKFESR